MVTGQLLRLSSAMSGRVLVDIYSSLSLLYYTFLHHALAIDYMNVDFHVMHQISTRNKRYHIFSDKLNTLVKFNRQIFICFQSVYSVLSVSLLTY
jgi:hypothetical protein